MITEKTVFVVGAGLSNDYGFPLGPELKNRILKGTDPYSSTPTVKQNLSILDELGFDAKEINIFRRQLATGVFDTIDLFLERREGDNYSRLRKLGRTAIAMTLIPLELPQQQVGQTDADFYSFLFDRMAKKTSKEAFAENKITIITYNYDRSYENFLQTALINHYDLTPAEANDMIKKMKIIHVHGSLGGMPWQDKTRRDYAPILSPTLVDIASKSIVTFNDADANSTEYVDARKEMSEASNLVFVGFGFHPMNLSRLAAGISPANKNRIIGTALGLSTVDIEEIEKITNGQLSLGHLRDVSAVSLIKELNWL